MTRHSFPGPVRAYRIAIASSAIAVGLTLTACGGTRAPSNQTAQPTTRPSASQVTATSFGDVTATPTQATVVGTLSVMFAITTPDSRPPREPLTYSLLVRESGDDFSRVHAVDPDGTFALALPPGTHQVTLLEVAADDLGLDPVDIPLTATRNLVLKVPTTGCVYGGEISVTYGQLPAGTEKEQLALVERASRNNEETYSFVYRAEGGFVLAGAGVSVKVESERPAAARGCATEKFTWVRA